MKVYLDAGHGGLDSGAVGSGRNEKDDNETLTNLVGDILESSGITVFKNSTANDSLQTVTKQSNDANVDLFVSIHRNAFDDTTANGLEVWVCKNARTVTRKNAQIVYDKMCSVTTEMKPRGIKESNFYVLVNTKAPAMLLEVGFVTNTNDNKLFDKYIFDYAEAIAKGICEVLNVPFLKRMYAVQIGVFTDKVQATQKMDEAKSKGFLEAKIV